MQSTPYVLPHQTEHLFLTDGGIETSLIYDEGLELPCFAAFHLLRDEPGRAALARYYEPYLAIAAAAGFGFVLESPSWRANPDWAGRLGYSKSELTAAIIDSIWMMQSLRDRHEIAGMPTLISGCVGPRGDGYVPSALMSADAAQAYHGHQIHTMAAAGCDLVTAMTMTNVPEAVGIVRAAADGRLPSVVSFTVETNGRLPSGESLEEAIAAVDEATASGPAYYMINCAHPTHFTDALDRGGEWTHRIGGLRANASCKSHAELDAATTLDRGDPGQLGDEYAALAECLPHLRVFGGCCGTSHHHVRAIAGALRVKAVPVT